MVEFCPECGNLLRKKPCKCGYSEEEDTSNKISLIKIWKPPSPNNVYCRITATSYEKLRSMLSKGIYPEKLKEIRKRIKNHLYSCINCVYYHEELSLCKFKNKYIQRDSICKSFEPYKEN
ncbi:MAG: hypothetical protein ACXAEX_07515 [Promethearchaeota archaeon]|jgi:hypothetical protein